MYVPLLWQRGELQRGCHIEEELTEMRCSCILKHIKGELKQFQPLQM